MGEKDSKKEDEKKKDDGGKKDDGPITVVLKLDLHCEGCSQKVKRSVQGFEGVQEMKGDINTNKLTVIGKVDPVKLRERVEKKTKKKVELISPLPKKEKDGEKKAGDKPEKETDEKKNKEPTVSTVVLKIWLHCAGCSHRIRQKISKIKGVQTVAVDPEKDQVTVKGTMDVKALVPYLKEKLNKAVEIIPAKKDDGAGGNKKEKDGGAEKKEKADGDGGKKEESGKIEGNKMEHFGHGYELGHGYEPGHMVEYAQAHTYAQSHSHAPQLFSDENPNGCSIM
ncbi:hypothetical protein HHK36_019205 [Tetracentron sinense]|uniref:HMA domain-containing protein n=1 Tax=Tetracentron sinense TaxID=13715 RepID=A0A835D9E1_TETSI|nr:hypothetical protein HHK36_019205 [Tetracentron sinense]